MRIFLAGAAGTTGAVAAARLVLVGSPPPRIRRAEEVVVMVQARGDRTDGGGWLRSDALRRLKRDALALAPTIETRD